MGQNNFLYIDLPGEPWNYSTFNGQLDVILRRHRDVVININLPSPFANFDLVSDQDWFFDVKSKKRVQKMTCPNGERVHIWVSRDFKGKLELKSGKSVYVSFDMQKLFATEKSSEYFTDYRYKPAPLVLEASPQGTKQVTIDPSQELMHISEVKSVNTAPPAILAAIRSGAESLKVDSQDVVTINWIIGQLAASAGYVADNKAWITELRNKTIRLQRVVHASGPKHYIIFKGTPGTRRLLTAARYGADNTKVLSILAGAGSFKGTARAAWSAANPSLGEFSGLKFKPTGAGLAIIFSMTVSVAEWYADYTQLENGKPKKDFFDLAAIVGVGLAKVAISGAAASLTLSLLATFGLAVGLTPVGLVVAGVAIVASVLVGYMVDAADKGVGASDGAAAGLRKSWQYLENKEPMIYKVQAKPYGGCSAIYPAVSYPAKLSR